LVALRRGALDRLVMTVKPLDVWRKQHSRGRLRAREWGRAEQYALRRGAYQYRDLERAEVRTKCCACSPKLQHAPRPARGAHITTQ